MKKQKIKAIILVVLAVFLVAFNIITSMFEGSIRVALQGSSEDEEAHADALTWGYELNQEVESEGIVLLRNEDDTLPISEDITKLNVFGVRSAHLVLNSAGSASGSNAEAATLKDSLENAGYEVNSSLWDMLEAVTVTDNTAVNEGGSSEAVNELDLSEYTGDCSFESAYEYSEYAIVTFSRLGGEGADQTRTGLGEDGTQSYLELTDNEKALLAQLKETGFKVIVLINSSYAMELGVLEEYDVDAALWIGGTGVKGALAIGEILNGTVNPSGRLVDTYAYDHTTAASYVPSDDYDVLDTAGEQIGGYTEYSEGIYVGYKWYETADAEGFWSSDFATLSWGLTDGYEDVVQYPFGYGLSYTTFSQAFASEPVYDEDTQTFTFEVEVTNTGDVDGKEVVQLYVETPYIDGGVEKSKVSLVAFDKTELLAADGSETITLTVAAEDIASYDTTADDGNGAYVLDAGSYTFYLGSGLTGAHCWADPEDSVSFELEEVVYAGDNKRDSDETAASNQLENGNVRNGEVLSVLSRSGSFANAQEAVFTAKNDLTVTEDSDLYAALVTNASAAGEYEGEILDDLTTEAEGTLTLADMITEGGAIDYDDEKWDELISQMSIDDLITLCGTGGWSTAAIESIGKEATTDIDGPYGLSNLIKNSMGTDVSCVSYCTEVVMASTWNTDLVNEIGQAVAAEADATSTSGWYAPGANIHRTPYGGRNPEYYSEDTLISGEMCAAEVDGALSKGLYVYIKHFAFNETESNRTEKQNCYIDEQTAREIYLKAFENTVKNDTYDEDGNQLTYAATGLMASYMWYENNWCGTDYSLMTTILRDEWGFKGMVITDNAAVVPEWITLNKAIYGGTDLMLVYKTAKMSSERAASDEGLSALKTSAKRILWTIADASGRRTTEATQGTDYWSIIFYLVNGITVAVMAVLAFLIFRGVRKEKKNA